MTRIDVIKAYGLIAFAFLSTMTIFIFVLFPEFTKL